MKNHQITNSESDYSSLSLISTNTFGILYEYDFGIKEIRYSSINIH